MDFLLNARRRKDIGRKVKALRKEGLFPMVIYGYKINAMPIQTSQKEFIKILKDAGESSIISVKIEGENSSMDVVIHDIAFDSSHKPIHADLYKIQKDKEIVSEIPLEFIGESRAVKEEKCILVKNLESVEVKCLPKSLPHSLIVNLDELKNAGDAIRINSIKTEKNVKIINDANDVVAMAEEPKMQENKQDVSAEGVKSESDKDASARNASRGNVGKEDNEEKQTTK